MGERKVLNKYYPPDFDPAKVPRATRPKKKQMKVANMLPMSIRCNRCGNYMSKGTKFNTPMEDTGETYLGIKIYRFYFKCKGYCCNAEIVIKTDPRNSDYTVESGANRNSEPWRAEAQQVEAEEMGDPMRARENKARDSKHKMDAIAALDEIKSKNSWRETVSTDDVLKSLQHNRSGRRK